MENGKLKNEKLNEKLIPEIRFKEFSGEWEEKRLGEIFEIKRGASPRPIQEYLSSDGVNWIKIGDINPESKYITQTKEKITKNGAKKSVKIYPNDFILSNSMSFGRPYISKIEGCIHDGWLLLRKKTKNIELEYLYYSLLTNVIQNKFKAIAAGSTVNNLKADNVKKIKIHIPPTLEEQQKIASFLSSIDEKIELTAKKIEKLKEYKKGLLQKLLNVKNKEPELRFQKFSGEWVEKRLGEVLIKISTGLNPRNNFKLNERGSYYYVTIKNFTKNRLYLNNCDKINKKAFELINKRADLQKNDILFASIGRIGDCYLIKETPKNWNINESVFSLRPNIKLIVPEFLCFVFMNRKMKSILESKVTGSTFKSIKINDLKKLKIHIPESLEEQQKIASFLSGIDEKIELNEQVLDKMKEYKRGLLQKMFV